VGGRPIRQEKVVFSNENGYMRMGPTERFLRSVLAISNIILVFVLLVLLANFFSILF